MKLFASLLVCAGVLSVALAAPHVQQVASSPFPPPLCYPPAQKCPAPKIVAVHAPLGPSVAGDMHRCGPGTTCPQCSPAIPCGPILEPRSAKVVIGGVRAIGPALADGPSQSCTPSGGKPGGTKPCPIITVLAFGFPLPPPLCPNPDSKGKCPTKRGSPAMLTMGSGPPPLCPNPKDCLPPPKLVLLRALT